MVRNEIRRNSAQISQKKAYRGNQSACKINRLGGGCKPEGSYKADALKKKLRRSLISGDATRRYRTSLRTKIFASTPAKSTATEKFPIAKRRSRLAFDARLCHGAGSARESFCAWTTVTEPVRAFALRCAWSLSEAWRACGRAVQQSRSERNSVRLPGARTAASVRRGSCHRVRRIPRGKPAARQRSQAEAPHT